MGAVDPDLKATLLRFRRLCTRSADYHARRLEGLGSPRPEEIAQALLARQIVEEIELIDPDYWLAVPVEYDYADEFFELADKALHGDWLLLPERMAELMNRAATVAGETLERSGRWSDAVRTLTQQATDRVVATHATYGQKPGFSLFSIVAQREVKP